ncbi:MAG: thioesterase [Micromonosporaceae bacterium]|nr:thioesterase [Micromonosporaceae bacterium]
MAVEVGLRARVELVVTGADTAQAVGSGDVPVVATPRLVALAEAATVRATAGRLPAASTTVGTRVELEHLAASGPGATVVAEAELSTVDGRRLGFAVTVTEAGRVVARGRIERAIVERARFLASVGVAP